MHPRPKTTFPKDRIKAVLLEGVHPVGASILRDEGFQVETVSGSPDRPKLLKLIRDAHIVGIRSKTDLPADVQDAAERLLTVGCFCIGTNQVDVVHARRKGIAVFNSPFSNTRSVAELTVAEVVALYRRLVDQSVRMHAGGWDKSAAGAHEVRGRTIGIVGYGHIGSQVSVLAESMGMRVIFHDILPKLALGNARQVKDLATLLKEADVITLHVPATQSTKNMIGAAQLRRMKQGAFLINNARGSVVDIPALADSIRTGHIGGAALDVFPHEPASKEERFESELRGLPNVILTPHVGGSTEEAQQAIAEDVAGKMLKFVNVGTTTGAVNVPEVELPGQEQLAESGPTKRRHRILHFHRNVPGVLSALHNAVAGMGANIWAEYLRTYEDVGYVVLDVDPVGVPELIRQIKAMPETIRVRALY
ncbi:MAG: phosphoglycerate dehydrogenase [Planctomycetes bacterium]|nr:phosphoglycerate dehydrogenase [Planctomycetota bacterium]